jgi:hypothetical protein
LIKKKECDLTLNKFTQGSGTLKLDPIFAITAFSICYE